MRKLAHERSEQILETAISLGSKGLFSLINRDEIAARVGISPTTVTHHWQIDDLRDAVISAGCERGIARLIVVGVSLNHPAAIRLSDAVKRAAITRVQ